MKAYKGRTLNPSKPVEVYRNLHKPGVVWSVRQDGLVIGHAKDIVVSKAQLKVSDAGRERVRREGKKNVHAFVKGFVSEKLHYSPTWGGLYYNPYQVESFVDFDSKEAVFTAPQVYLSSDGPKPVVMYEKE